MNTEHTPGNSEALARELRAFLDNDHFTLIPRRYADVFDDYWTMGPVTNPPGGKTDVVIVEGRLPDADEYAGDSGAIAWLVMRVLSGHADDGPRYLVSGPELPPHLQGLSDLLHRAVAPHIALVLNDGQAGGYPDVPALAARFASAALRNDRARAHLKSLLITDFLAPVRCHVVSNLVSPTLLLETLNLAYPNLPRGGVKPVVKAIRSQLCTLGLLDSKPISGQDATEALLPVVESARKRIRAACGGQPETHPISMQLFEDNQDFEPILEAVLGRDCGLSLSLPSSASPCFSQESSILFVDLRLVPEDDWGDITDASGFLYAIRRARERPDLPIVLFSSTQQRNIQDAVKEAGETEGIHNIITRFSKPSLSAHGGLNAKSCMKSLKNLAEAGVEAVMMIEQSRMTCVLKDKSLVSPLYSHRWLEVLLSPAVIPHAWSSADVSTAAQDMELIREFSVRWAVHPQMAEALRVDVTDKRAGWVWALTMIRGWLITGDARGMADFLFRLEAGLLTDYNEIEAVRGILDVHPATSRDSTHDVLLWATAPETVSLPVAIKTIIHHICRGTV